MRVLLVDISQTDREIVRRCLKVAGVGDVVAVGDGQAGLRHLETEPFDLVLTDWQMPLLSGKEFVQRVRLLQLELPVLMMVPESGRCEIVNGLRAGISDYLIKPFSPETIQTKLRKLLQTVA